MDEARADVARLKQGSQVIEGLPTGDLLEAWPDLTPLEKREILAAYLDHVSLSSANGRSRWSKIEERTKIVTRS